jgi:hypothetical protein
MARRPLREPPKSDEPIPDDLRIVFGQNLRAARVKAGLTQAQLAERTGLTQQYVSLATDKGLARFALRCERVEFLFEPFLGRFASVNRAALAACVTPRHRRPPSGRRLDPVLRGPAGGGSVRLQPEEERP